MDNIKALIVGIALIFIIVGVILFSYVFMAISIIVVALLFGKVLVIGYTEYKNDINNN